MKQSWRIVLVGLALVVGAILGWFLIGYLVFPKPTAADPRDLDAAGKAQYVALTIESWSVNQDLPAARERLRSFDNRELAVIVNQLIDERNGSGHSAEAEQLRAFAQSYGLDLATANPSAPAARTNVAQQPTRTLVPAQPTQTITPGATETPADIHVTVAESIQGPLREAIESWADDQSLVLAPGQNPELKIGTKLEPGAQLLTERFYVVADYFPTLLTGITAAEVRGLWQGKTTSAGVKTLLVSDETAPAFAEQWGAPAATVKRVKPEEMVAQVWSIKSALALVPFDQLTVKLTALPLDNVSLLSRRAKMDSYPLVTRTYVSGDPNLAQALADAVHVKFPLTNRYPERITSVIMTGVTAISRTSIVKIDQKNDPALPARVVAPILSAADITHVSNEVPFVDNCQANLGTTVLCSRTSYIATLKLAGVDIVGLTGNHLLDYGPAGFLKTLDLFDSNGFKYYGGGRNATEARKPLYITDHGNKLAFLGANSFGPPNDWATDARPGAQRYDAAAVKQDIAAARKQADVVFYEQQAEEWYEYGVPPNNLIHFHNALAWGADVITGVQAHQPEGFEFSDDGRRIILFGLGNLFFDQMFDIGVRQGIVARHTIYQGRLLSTELLPTMLEDYVQPRWATPEERQTILRTLFAASGFK